MAEPVTPEFTEEFDSRKQHGMDVLSGSKIAIVGLARNCGKLLELNLLRIAMLTQASAGWRCMICENDSTDDTKSVIEKFRSQNPKNVAAIMRNLGRKHRPSEMAGPRTVELAEYRAECQEWVRRSCQECEYTVIVDWDSWGGWNHEGAMTGFSYCATEEKAYGFASVSMIQHPFLAFDPDKKETVRSTQWVHYDCWALRLNAYWDDYGSGFGGWKHNWLPMVGSPPIRVCSAFGGFAIYNTEDFLKGNYSGQDCEHVTFHRSLNSATGKDLYLNPSQRTIMHWIESDENDGNSSGDVQG